MKLKEKAARYDALVEHLRWTFDYWLKKYQEADTPDDMAGAEKFFKWFAHENFYALQKFEETDGRVCPCGGCISRTKTSET